MSLRLQSRPFIPRAPDNDAEIASQREPTRYSRYMSTLKSGQSFRLLTPHTPKNGNPEITRQTATDTLDTS